MPKILSLLFFAILLAPVSARAVSAPTTTTLSLQKAIDIALQNSTEYRSARVSINISIADIQSARAPLGPSVTLREQYQYQTPVAQITAPFGAIPFTPRSTNVPILAAQYALLDGSTRARVGQAYANAAAAQAQAREVRGEVIAEVSRSYYDLIAASTSRSVATYGVELARQRLHDTQQRYAVGLVPRAEVLQSESDLAERQLDQIEERNTEALALDKLNAVMNVPLTTSYAAMDTLPLTVPDMDVESLIRIARASRAEVTAAEQAVASAGYGVLAARSGRAPLMSATFSEGNVQPPVSPGFRAQFTVALTAVWKLFDSGEARARTDAAQGQMEKAQLALDQMRTSIELEIRQAYLNMLSGGERIGASRHALALADENERLAEIRYRNGVGTSLELHDAQLRELSARHRLLGAQVSVAKSLADLRFAAGLL